MLTGMNGCLAAKMFEEAGESAIRGFEERVAALPQDLRAPFHSEARQLEAEMLTIYKLVALFVRDEQDLAQIASAWASMVRICDDSLLKLGNLIKQQPSSGADYYFDRLLDLRNKCLRLQKIHE